MIMTRWLIANKNPFIFSLDYDLEYYLLCNQKCWYITALLIHLVSGSDFEPCEIYVYMWEFFVHFIDFASGEIF